MAICDTILCPLGIEKLLVGHLAGSMTVFIVLAVVLVAIMAHKWGMKSSVMTMMIVLLLGILGIANTGFLYIPIIIILGVTLGIIVSEMFK